MGIEEIIPTAVVAAAGIVTVAWALFRGSGGIAIFHFYSF